MYCGLKSLCVLCALDWSHVHVLTFNIFNSRNVLINLIDLPEINLRVISS